MIKVELGFCFSYLLSANADTVPDFTGSLIKS